MAVDGTRGQDLAVAGQHLGRRPDHQVGVHAVHRVGVAGLAERHDPTVLDADVGLDDPPVVQHDRTGDHQVRRALRRGAQRLAHGLADDLAAAEDGLVAGEARPAGQVVLDLDEQVGVGQADAVAHGGAVERGVPRPGQDRAAHDASASAASAGSRAPGTRR